MRMSRYFLAAVIIGLTEIAMPLRAMTIDACKTQLCEKYAADNRTACSELPSNPSCLPTAERMLGECLASCEKYPVSEPDPPPIRPVLGGCDPDHRRCY